MASIVRIDLVSSREVFVPPRPITRACGHLRDSQISRSVIHEKPHWGRLLMERHALRDDQFARIEHMLPGRPGTVGRNSYLGNRVFVDAVIWKFRVGTPWRDLPERFGGWCNTHKRFSRWAMSGVWERLFKTLADDPDNEYAMIDATIVRAHQHSAGARKKGVSTKPLARWSHDENPRDRRCQTHH